MHIIWLPTPFWSGRKSDDKAMLAALQQNIARLATAKASLIAISGVNGRAARQRRAPERIKCRVSLLRQVCFPVNRFRAAECPAPFAGADAESRLKALTK